MTDHEVALARLGMRLFLRATPLLHEGRQVGEWTLVEYLPAADQARGGDHHPYWLCRCSCGTLGKVQVGVLRSGRSRSCGCAIRRAA